MAAQLPRFVFVIAQIFFEALFELSFSALNVLTIDWFLILECVFAKWAFRETLTFAHGGSGGTQFGVLRQKWGTNGFQSSSLLTNLKISINA
jgi:hypothetical protein